jgi:CheY-like chemotaxis protein
MERTDWLDTGFDSVEARFLMVTAITHHQFSSPIWGEDEVRKLHAELAEIELLANRAVTDHDAAAGLFRLPAMCRRRPCCHTCLVRCLLVDDNSAFIETARLLLAREGVVVAGTAASTAEALRQVSALRPDVVLVDIALGDENGFDLARRLAVDDTGGAMVVIMISTRGGADYADMVADSPAAGFLSKDELSAAAIQRILGRA